MDKKIGFIGIGNMGLPMVRSLINTGYHVTVYDKNMERAGVLVCDGAKLAKNLRDVIKDNLTIITMLPDDQELLEVTLGKHGIGRSLGANNVHISMSTVSPETSQRVFDIHQKYGTDFVAAPVFGRPEAAITKKLGTFISGDAKVKRRVQPILESLCQRIFDFGENITASSMIKLAANFLILSAIESLGEAFAFVKKNGLDHNLFADMLVQTLFDCTAYRYHAHNIAAQSFDLAGFRLSLGLKDISLLMQSAQESHVPLPLASVLRDKLLKALAKNRGELDWAAITMDALENT